MLNGFGTGISKHLSRFVLLCSALLCTGCGGCESDDGRSAADSVDYDRAGRGATPTTNARSADQVRCKVCMNDCFQSYVTCSSDCYKQKDSAICDQNCVSNRNNCEARWCDC